MKLRLLKNDSHSPTETSPTQTAKTTNNELPSHVHGYANKVFASEALVAVNYKKADLNAIASNCKDLTEEQQTKLLAVLQ